jgi:hypothetical protein
MNKIINVAGGAGDMLACLFDPNEEAYNSDRVWGNNHIFSYMFQPQEVQVCHLNSENDEYSFLQHTNDFTTNVLFIGYNDYDIPMRRYAIHNHIAKLGTSAYTHQSKIIENASSNLYNIPRSRVLYCDTLHTDSELNKRLYSEFVEFFGLEEDYPRANRLYKAWKDCDKRIEQAFYDFFTSQEFANRLADTISHTKHI